MSVSVVFQAFSETGTFGVDYAIAAASVVKVLRRMGITALVKNEGLEGEAWATASEIPEATDEDIENCEVLIRAWPAGQWPVRPNGPRVVVDFVLHAADRSRAADFVIACEADPDDPTVPGLIIWDTLFPLPLEVNEVVTRIVEGNVMIHLGQDPMSRLIGIRNAINGFSGMGAAAFSYPPDGTAEPWLKMGSGDIGIATPEFPYRLMAGLRIPTILVASTPEELTRAEEIIARGNNSAYLLGYLSGFTNNQVRDAAFDLVSDEMAKRVARLGGSEQRAAEGVLRISNWVARELVGRGLAKDPFQVQGFDTILNSQEDLPLNAADAHDLVAEETEQEVVEVQIDTFFADGTWTKPDGAKSVHVEIVDGGGGGGSGRRGAGGTQRGGGGGGAGGGQNDFWFPAETLPATVAVTVGQGGVGGAAQTVDNTDGVDGSAATRSLFGDFAAVGDTFVAASYGGTKGLKGAAGAGGAGGTAPVTDEDWVRGGRGSDGGNGGAPGLGGSSGTTARKNAAGGGGGGSNINAGNNDTAAGGTGAFGSTGRGLPFSGGTGTPNADGPNGESAPSGLASGGGGGAGGGVNNAADAGSGGNGGNYGGGGGGGGAAANGFNSGAGGNGANGIVVVTTYF